MRILIPCCLIALISGCDLGKENAIVKNRNEPATPNEDIPEPKWQQLKRIVSPGDKEAGGRSHYAFRLEWVSEPDLTDKSLEGAYRWDPAKREKQFFTVEQLEKHGIR